MAFMLPAVRRAGASRYSGSVKSSRSARAQNGLPSNGSANACTARLRTIRPAAVCGAKNPRNRVAPFCLPETNVRSRPSYAANARAQSPSARCSSPARTYASSIPRPVPSPASSDGQAAASPTSATPTGAPLRQMDLAHAIEVHVLGRVHRVEQFRHFPSHLAVRLAQHGARIAMPR